MNQLPWKIGWENEISVFSSSVPPNELSLYCYRIGSVIQHLHWDELLFSRFRQFHYKWLESIWPVLFIFFSFFPWALIYYTIIYVFSWRESLYISHVQFVIGFSSDSYVVYASANDIIIILPYVVVGVCSILIRRWKCIYCGITTYFIIAIESKSQSLIASSNCHFITNFTRFIQSNQYPLHFGREVEYLSASTISRINKGDYFKIFRKEVNICSDTQIACMPIWEVANTSATN